MTTKTEQEFMIDCITTDIILYLMRDYSMTEEIALRTLFQSNYYSQLINTNTDLFTQSSLYNYRLLKQEIATAKPKALNTHRHSIGLPPSPATKSMK